MPISCGTPVRAVGFRVTASEHEVGLTNLSQRLAGRHLGYESSGLVTYMAITRSSPALGVIATMVPLGDGPPKDIHDDCNCAHSRRLGGRSWRVHANDVRQRHHDRRTRDELNCPSTGQLELSGGSGGSLDSMALSTSFTKRSLSSGSSLPNWRHRSAIWDATSSVDATSSATGS